MKKLNFQAKIWPFYRPSLPKYKDIFKILTYDQIAKIALKSLHPFMSYLEKPEGVKMTSPPLVHQGVAIPKKL